MSFIIIFVVLILLLFGLAYLTKRRYGVLGLALAAGSMMSALWVSDVTPMLVSAGVTLTRPPLESVVSAGLILLPALLLITSGPAYHKTPQRVIGALLFALFAGVLLLQPLGSALIMEGVGQQVYLFLGQNRQIIITLCMTDAIIDLLLTKTPKHIPKH